MLLDGRGRPVGGQHLALERVQPRVEGKEARWRRPRRQGEAARQVQEVTLRLRRPQVEEAAVGRGAASVVQARVIEDGGLGRGRLRHRAQRHRTQRGHVGWPGPAQVVLQHHPHTAELRFEGGGVAALLGCALGQVDRGVKVLAHRREPEEGQQPAPVTQRLLHADEAGRGGVLDLLPHLVRRGVRGHERGPARQLGGQGVGRRLRARSHRRRAEEDGQRDPGEWTASHRGLLWRTRTTSSTSAGRRRAT
jgi:hypothetical protein